MTLDEVKEMANQSFKMFLTCVLAPHSGDVKSADGRTIGTLVDKTAKGYWRFDCGPREWNMGDEALDAKDMSNLVQWWNGLGEGRVADDKAVLCDDNKKGMRPKVHLYADKHQEGNGSLVKFRLNFHVPLKGKMSVQVKAVDRDRVTNCNNGTGQVRIGNGPNMQYVRKG